jgi:hypothetical protein
LETESKRELKINKLKTKRLLHFTYSIQLFMILIQIFLKEADTIEKLLAIENLIKSFKIGVKDAWNDEATNKLKGLIEDIDCRICDLKKSQNERLEDYKIKEKLLYRDIEAYNNKIELWTNAPEKELSVNNQDSSFLNEKFLSSNIKECIDFEVRFLIISYYFNRSSIISFCLLIKQSFVLKNGGTYGGWEEIDHLLFLKLRNKYKVTDVHFM